MKKYWRSKIKLVLLMCCYTSSSLAGPIKQLPGFQWEHTLGDNKADYFLKGAILSRQPKRFLVAALSLSLPIDPTHSKWNLLIWEINNQGVAVGEIVKRDFGDASYYPDVMAMGVLQNGLIVISFENRVGRAQLLGISPHGGVDAFTTEIKGSEGNSVVSQIIPTDNGDFLVTGYYRNEFWKGFIKRFNAEGHVVWDKTFDHGKMNFISSGISLPNGSFIVVANSGSFEPDHTGPSTIWVVKLDNSGNVMLETSFPGRWGKIASDDRGTCVIAYDKDSETNPKIHLKAITPDLSEVWDVEVFSGSNDPLLRPPYISAIPHKGFVLTGNNQSRPWIAMVDPSGRVKWNFLGAGVIWDPGILSIDKDIYCLWTLHDKTNEQIIRVIKFQVD